jgi:hypothetical protein
MIFFFTAVILSIDIISTFCRWAMSFAYALLLSISVSLSWSVYGAIFSSTVPIQLASAAMET